MGRELRAERVPLANVTNWEETGVISFATDYLGRPKVHQPNNKIMKNTTQGIFGLFFAGTLVLASTGAQAQCTTWVNPTPATGWVDFNTNFGGAPCDDGTGCPFNEITDFEVFADEAYRMDNVQAGGSYTFSACNGTGGTAWDLYFTIIAPSGAVDASGLNDGSICELTWTASESGIYLIVVSEDGACGTSENADVANGFPAITCNGVSCPAPQPGCTTWVNPSASTGWTDFNTEFGGAPVPDNGTCPVNEITTFEVFADEAYSMENVVAGTAYIFSACNGTGGTAWPLYFTVINPNGIVDAHGLDAGSTCSLTWTASASGTYLIVVSEAEACGVSENADVANGFPAITCLGNVGIDQAAAIGGAFRIYPNPTMGLFTVDLQGVRTSANDRLEVLDISGRHIVSEQLGADLTKRVDLTAQPAGSYFVNIHQADRVLREKLVLVKD
jgi:hypothetical protein